MELPEISLLLVKAGGSQYDMIWSSLKIHPKSNQTSPPRSPSHWASISYTCNHLPETWTPRSCWGRESWSFSQWRPQWSRRGGGWGSSMLCWAPNQNGGGAGASQMLKLQAPLLKGVGLSPAGPTAVHACPRVWWTSGSHSPSPLLSWHNSVLASPSWVLL